MQHIYILRLSVAKVIAPLRVLKPRHFSNKAKMDIKSTGINLRTLLFRVCSGINFSVILKALTGYLLSGIIKSLLFNFQS